MFRVGFVAEVVDGFSGRDDEFNSGFELGDRRMTVTGLPLKLRRTEA